MKRYFQFCFLVVFALVFRPNFYAQGNPLSDSLRNHLISLVNDTEKAETLLALSEEFQRVPDSMLHYAMEYQTSDCPPEIIMSGRKNSKGFEFRITDNGLGIDKKYQAQIFEAFKRLHTSDTYQGVGIGLAIVKRIVKRHEATIEVESTPEKGSTFIIQFPAVPGSPQR